MDFFQENLRQTISAINSLMDKTNEITVKKIRNVLKVKSTNHSKINFIWRVLRVLEKHGVLEIIGTRSPKIYGLKVRNKINASQFLKDNFS